MRKLPHLTLLFVVSLFAACTCISAEIENKTDEPIFVSEVDHLRGRTYEDFGHLVMPGESASIPIYYGGQYIRARDMRGNTVFYSPAPEKESTFEVTSLQPIPNAMPLGSPNGIGPLGTDSRSSLKTCRDGEDVTIPLYGLLATVKNESAKALLVRVDIHPGVRVSDWKEGVFAPPGQAVQIFANVAEEPYVRAYDQEGQLVYLERFTRTEHPVVVIPAALPPNPPPSPMSPYNSDCVGGPETDLALVAIFGLFVLSALVALFVTLRFFWELYVRKRSS
jgi:hypothetical protein